ncbi:Uncharacterised protein [Buttiauxella agrestis]|uniref:ATP-binding protein n=1 Tax=Buttiauxella agrestis TaxID=82977 RepID=A0A381C639_9ENTR|nr:hypothetical protein [Buttiauxella agrestis]SUW63277.1 Uncharacterised protein [Buttiauxella agrestis]
MKKIEKLFNKAIKRLIKKKFLRSIVSNKNIKGSKTKRNGKKKKSSTNKIVAPTILDIYNPNHHENVLNFIETIERRAEQEHSKSHGLFICFRNTIYISAAAGLYLLAKLENLRSNYPLVKYTVTRPPFKTTKKGEHHVVDSVLNRIGIYSAFGVKGREMKENPSVKCWEVIRGELVDSEMAGKLLETVAAKMGEEYTDLYRPLIEAMSNSVEHAYRDDLYDNQKKTNKNKWWCFAAIMNNKLVLLICDLGVGIPRTLKLTQGEKVLSKLIELMGKPIELDSEHIKASLQVKRTRTKLGYRGKGGTDLQSIIENFKNAQLRIISNNGNYRYTEHKRSEPEKLWDAKKSINGTIVEWSIPLPTERGTL